MAQQKKAPKHEFEFESEYDDKAKETILTVEDAVSGKKWQKILGATSSFPRLDYDRMLKVFNDDTVAFNCHVIKANQNLMVYFSKDNINIHQWEFDLCE